jgi:hypothetical protein
MTGTKQSSLDVVELDLGHSSDLLRVYIEVYDNSLSRKWLSALNSLLEQDYHLEKNYCFFGFADGPRNGAYILDQINLSIQAINNSSTGYHIDDHFDMINSVDQLDGVNHDHFNQLHRYFEFIRQLNLLCHEFESWQLSWRKKHTAPEWQRPSQLMCWLSAPRFVLDETDYELFGIETINRSLGGVYVGVNKAVGKHHWEVFQDEGRDSRISELVTTSLRPQTEAAGDFDIEWANNPGTFPWQIQQLKEFREWLTVNGIDPEDKSLTIGHPQVGQVDLLRSFGTADYRSIWAQLQTHLNVVKIKTSTQTREYNYNWTDKDYAELQIRKMK